MAARLSWFYFLLSLAIGIYAAKTNRTIDDTNGDSATGQVPLYIPTTAWDGNDCTRCLIQPDASRAHAGTWTAATYNPSLGEMTISFSFIGTDLYVYFILANDQGNGITTETAVNFTLDSNQAGDFHHEPSDDETLEYDSLVFSINGLEQSTHEFLISTAGDTNIFVNFDYAIYTFDSDPKTSASASISSTGSSVTSTSSSTAESTTNSNISAIVGGIIGGIVGLAAFGLAIFFFLKRRRQSQKSASIDIDGDDRRPGPSTPIQRYGEQPMSFANSQSLLPLTTARASDYEVGPNPYSSTPSTSHSTTGRPRAGSSSSRTQFFVSNADPNGDHYPPRDVPPALPSSGYTMSTAKPSGNSGFALPPGAAPPHSGKSDLRRQRQLALEQQMRQIQEEMTSLTAQESGAVPARNRVVQSDVEMRELRSQILVMKEQMRMLATQQQSPWAQGLSDLPPPGYSPSLDVEPGTVISPRRRRKN